MISREVEVNKPALTYKLTFLFGGIGFAAITYAIGTWLYEKEVSITHGKTIAMDIGDELQRIIPDHLITLIPWLVGTTMLSIALGYLFDKQVKYRKRAEELQAKAEMLAVVDGLTQIYNHTYFLEQLGFDIKINQRKLVGFALLLLDLDDFKMYNDTHGHLLGDELLKHVARIIKATVRETDLLARYGGEEFVVIARGSDKEQTIVLAERIREAVALDSQVTVSIGVAGYPQNGETVEQLIQTADRAMYSAKRSGKNQVVVA